MTASGGNIIESEFNRNKRAPQCGVAQIEVAGEGFDDRQRRMDCLKGGLPGV